MLRGYGVHLICGGVVLVDDVPQDEADQSELTADSSELVEQP